MGKMTIAKVCSAAAPRSKATTKAKPSPEKGGANAARRCKPLLYSSIIERIER